jgi:hypothetical protein
MEDLQMDFNRYLRQYWHMTEAEFFTFSHDTQRRIRHAYATYNARRASV